MHTRLEYLYTNGCIEIVRNLHKVRSSLRMNLFPRRVRSVRAISRAQCASDADHDA